MTSVNEPPAYSHIHPSRRDPTTCGCRQGMVVGAVSIAVYVLLLGILSFSFGSVATDVVVGFAVLVFGMSTGKLLGLSRSA